MNLLADESVDKPIVDRLRRDGHTVLYIAELDPSIDDDAVLHRANQNSALLITADKDFGELVFRMGQIHAGVVLFQGAWQGCLQKRRRESYRLRLPTEATNYSLPSVSFRRE